MVHSGVAAMMLKAPEKKQKNVTNTLKFGFLELYLLLVAPLPAVVDISTGTN